MIPESKRPFRVVPETDFHTPSVVSADGRVIAHVYGPTREERAATVAAMAVVWEMLEALRDIRGQFIEYVNTDREIPDIMQVERAIEAAMPKEPWLRITEQGVEREMHREHLLPDGWTVSYEYPGYLSVNTGEHVWAWGVCPEKEGHWSGNPEDGDGDSRIFKAGSAEEIAREIVKIMQKINVAEAPEHSREARDDANEQG